MITVLALKYNGGKFELAKPVVELTLPLRLLPGDF